MRRLFRDFVLGTAILFTILGVLSWIERALTPEPALEITVSGDLKRPTFNIRAVGVRSGRSFAVWVADPIRGAQLLWDTVLVKVPETITYGRPVAPQLFPANHASPTDIPEGHLVFVQLVWWDPIGEPQLMPTSICFRVEGAARKSFSQQECYDRWVPPPLDYLKRRAG